MEVRPSAKVAVNKHSKVNILDKPLSDTLDYENLLELSLSIEAGVNLNKTATLFIQKLVDLKGLSHAYLWIDTNLFGRDGWAYEAVYSYPSHVRVGTVLFKASSFIQNLKITSPLSIDLDQINPGFIQDLGLDPIPGTAFHLEKLGVLYLCNENKAIIFSEKEKKMLIPVFKKFSQALEASILKQNSEEEYYESSMYAAQFRSIMINGALDAFFVINDRGIISEWNPQAEKLFGWKRAEVIGETLEKIIVPYDYCDAHINALLSCLKLGNTELLNQRLDIVTLQKSGEAISIELSLVQVETKYGNIYSGHARDITAFKTKEKKQKQLMHELELANRDLKDFAHMVSHDLKAPLRGIRNLSDMLYEDLEASLNDESKQYFELLNNRVELLKSLIQGILEYSQSGRQKKEEKVIDVQVLLKDLFEALAPPEHIEMIIANEMPTLLINEISIRQIFQNLVSNAIKYIDKPKGRIEIGFRQRRNNLVFWVKDNGPGIPEKDYQRIFKIFQTVAKTHTYESTGVGLAIVKKLLSSYNGKIWIKSELGTGTCFYFSLSKNLLCKHATDKAAIH